MIKIVMVGGVPGFNPKQVTINPGDTVKWECILGTHTVTADDGLFDSGLLNSGDIYGHDYLTEGVFPYYCKLHGKPGGIGMSGVVIVTI